MPLVQHEHLQAVSLPAGDGFFAEIRFGNIFGKTPIRSGYGLFFHVAYNEYTRDN